MVEFLGSSTRFSTTYSRLPCRPSYWSSLSCSSYMASLLNHIEFKIISGYRLGFFYPFLGTPPPPPEFQNVSPISRMRPLFSSTPGHDNNDWSMDQGPPSFLQSNFKKGFTAEPKRAIVRPISPNPHRRQISSVDRMGRAFEEQTTPYHFGAHGQSPMPSTSGRAQMKNLSAGSGDDPYLWTTNDSLKSQASMVNRSYK